MSQKQLKTRERLQRMLLLSRQLVRNMPSFRRVRGSELAEYYSYDAQELTNLAKAMNSGVSLRAELGTIGLYLGAYEQKPLWMYGPLGQEANTVYLQVHDGVTLASSADFNPDQPAPVLSASSSTSSAKSHIDR